MRFPTDTQEVLPKESIQESLLALICADTFADILRTHTNIIGEIIPEILPMVGFIQHNPYHIYDVFEHTIKAMELVPPLPILRLTMLLHDIAKPLCFSKDDQGIGHFYGHPKLGGQMAHSILTRLQFDSTLIQQVAILIQYHYTYLSPAHTVLNKLLQEIGLANLQLLFIVRFADDHAKSLTKSDDFADITALETSLQALIKTTSTELPKATKGRTI